VKVIAVAVLVGSLACGAACAVGASSSVVDETLVCSTSPIPGAPDFHLDANSVTRFAGHRFPAGASVQSGDSALVAFAIGEELGVLTGFCSPSKAAVPLSAQGLTRALLVSAVGSELDAPCYAKGRLLVHVRVTESGGRVTSGTLAVRLLAGRRPVFFAESSGSHTTAYAAGRICFFTPSK
jgi:hypothetical protein